MTPFARRSRTPRRLVHPGFALSALCTASLWLFSWSPGAAIDCPPCDDLVACTIDACDTTTGMCTHTPYTCDDGNQCTIDVCVNNGQCMPIANSRAACEDGNACTILDECIGDQCYPGTPRFCNDSNPCTADSCNSATGCIFVPVSGGCDDGNACTGGDACAAGACQAGAPISCNDGNPCTDDSCDSHAGCRNIDNSLPCDDGQSCTTNDTCSAGLCTGEGTCPCADADGDGFAECSSGVCDPAGLQCGDCDDDQAAVHPGAGETCNHIDDDCDASVDEGSDRAWDSLALDDPAGGSAGDRYGAAIAKLGDVTGDGLDDLAIGVPGADTPAGLDAGSVVIFSGADRSVHCRALSSLSGARMGTSLAELPDLTGDGVPDLVAGAPGSLRAVIVSGADCSVARSCTDSQIVQAPEGSLQSYQALGMTVASAGDVNGDGFADIIAGDPAALMAIAFPGGGGNHFFGLGRVAVFSGANCAVLRRMLPAFWTDQERFGSKVANVGDLTGDGVDEFAVGTPDPRSDTASLDFGTVGIYSGANGALLRTLQDSAPEAARGHLGAGGIEVLPDINGDAAADFAIGEPDGDAAGQLDSGSVLLFSGVDGSILRRCTAPDAQAGDHLGSTVAIVPDLDGDGLPEVAAAAWGDDVDPLVDAGSIVIFSSADCGMLERLVDPAGTSGASLGTTGLALAGNLAGDPSADLVAGTSFPSTPARNGHAVIFHSASQCPATCDPSPEICDGLDNDCDDVADNGDPGGGLACTTSQPGICAAGTTHCTGGAIDCVQNAGPAAEVCNGFDDDCDGAVDEIDQDADGVPDCTDNCPTIPNPDQNPCACDDSPACVGLIGPVADRTTQGGAIIRWTTTFEFDVVGFYVVEYNKGTRIPLTPSLVPCQQCGTGLGASYAVPIAKHKSGRDLFVERVRLSGVQSFPVQKNW